MRSLVLFVFVSSFVASFSESRATGDGKGGVTLPTCVECDCVISECFYSLGDVRYWGTRNIASEDPPTAGAPVSTATAAWGGTCGGDTVVNVVPTEWVFLVYYGADGAKTCAGQVSSGAVIAASVDPNATYSIEDTVRRKTCESD